MSVGPSVAAILSDHTTLEVECIDRLYLNCYVEQLMYAGGITRFFKKHRGNPVPSSALMAPITRQFVADIEHFAELHHIPLITFKKDQRKDDVTQQMLAQWPDGQEGVLYIGKAQEKTRIWRTRKVRNAEGTAYPRLVTDTAMVNHYYFYVVDADFGPLFIKFGSYFPYTAKVCLNGHHFAQRQADAAGIGYTPLDNGFADCADPAALQAICDRLDAETIETVGGQRETVERGRGRHGEREGSRMG
jgi:hypothetical protein